MLSVVWPHLSYSIIRLGWSACAWHAKLLDMEIRSKYADPFFKLRAKLFACEAVSVERVLSRVTLHMAKTSMNVK